MKYLAALLATLAIPVFFISGRSSAASQSYSYDPTNNPVTYHTFDATEIGFQPKFLSIEVNTTPNYGAINGLQIAQPNGTNTGYSFTSDNNGYYLALFTVYTTTTLSSGSRFGSYTSVVLTFYDTNPMVSTPCPECPEQPDLPYGEKLDRLYYAVIIVSATMLVLYFMFAIYSMFFKGLK